VAIVTYFARGSYGPEGEERAAYLKETNVLVKREGGLEGRPHPCVSDLMTASGRSEVMPEIYFLRNRNS
jgi:hypothetical protein